jgi:hypothetical protein
MIAINQNTGRRYRILTHLLSLAGFEGISHFQNQRGLKTDGKFGPLSYRSLYTLLLNPIDVPFHDYPIGEVFPKKQIIIHHSAGWDNARGMFQDWDRDARRGVSTSVGIDDNGRLFRGFDEQFWGHAIGVEEHVFKQRNLKNISNLMLNRQAIQVEICSFGGLTPDGRGGFKNWIGNTMPHDKVDKIRFRDFPAFERYTDKENDTLKTWILLNAMRFDIPLDYKGQAFWNVNNRALGGEPGIWGHCSFRLDKTDPYPQPQLIETLNNLSQYENEF